MVAPRGQITHHTNNGLCPKCIEIFDRYPKFNLELRNWFFAFQKDHPEAHVSCAGRGEAEQEADFNKKPKPVTKAHYGQSAHNFNCAIDIFVNDPVNFPGNIYPSGWYKKILAPAIPAWLNWYGKPGSPYEEMPHVEVRAWHELEKTGTVALVEKPGASNGNIA